MEIRSSRVADASEGPNTIANSNAKTDEQPVGTELKDLTGADLSGEHNTIANNKVDCDGNAVDMEMNGVKVVDGSQDYEQSEFMRHTRRDTLTEKRDEEEFDFVARLLTPYSKFLVNYPSVIIILTIIIVVLSVVLGGIPAVGGKGIPDFAKPVKGYSARGTDVALKRIAGGHLKSAYWKGNLSYTRVPRRKRSLSERNLGDIWFNEAFRIVYESINGGNLFDHMVAVCQWYKEKIMTHPMYSYRFSSRQVHHIPNYIALLSGQKDCENITYSDTQQFVSILKDCARYYKDNSLQVCSSSGKCDVVSRRCKFHTSITRTNGMAQLLYNVFHELGDSGLKNNPSFLKLTASISDVDDLDFSYDVYLNTLTDLKATEYHGIKVVAFTMWNLKFRLFSKEIINQLVLLIIAIVIVILLTWVFSGSFFLGLMTLGCIIAAMLIAFFVYNRIFDMPFFPFLNITVLIFIIGIGADDVFVYTGEWAQAKEIYKIYDASLRISYMIKWTTHTLRHAAVSMFVTSVTTAAAFYANISSNVIAVKCFGLFSGTAIIVNYLLMITLFPCCVVIHEKYFSKCMHFCCPSICRLLPAVRAREKTNNDGNNNNNGHTTRTSNVTRKCKEHLSAMSDAFFDKYLPRMLYSMRYIFVTVFFIVGVVGVVVAFGKPGLNPPSTDSFQMFSSTHPIEQYDLFIKKKFDSGVGNQGGMIAIDFVFGVKLVDNGNKFDPDDKGSLELKEGELEIARDQIWLMQFCKNIEAAFFYVQSESCKTIRTQFFDKLTDPCDNNTMIITDRDNNTCCNNTLPMSKKEYKSCFYKMIQGHWIYEMYQPLYSNGILKTFVIKVQTNYNFSMVYSQMRQLVEELDSWTSLQMRNVSNSFKGWWMADDIHVLRHYDLQDSLIIGTKISLGIAIAVAFFVILFTSLNIILSIFSVITILFIISITVGILIGAKWDLNIVESTVFSVAAGLSADFTMHYSISYRLSFFKGDRKRRTENALSLMGPAIFMGAVTTFIGGLVMCPSTVLAYIQIGTFLMVVMFISWLYSNFFFLPLCILIGPTNNFGQIDTCCRKEKTPIQSPQDEEEETTT